MKIITATILSVITIMVFGQQKPIPSCHKPAITKKRTEAFFNRTNKALFYTKKILKIEHQFPENFKMAIAHQLLAKKHIQERLWQQAIYHSMRARILLKNAVMTSNGIWNEMYDFDADEKTLIRYAPPDIDLDENVNVSQDFKSFNFNELNL